MRHLLTLAFLSLNSLFTIEAFAACTAPPSPGVRICSPTPNATVVYGLTKEVGASDQFPFLDFNSTPAPGAQIIKVKAYDNNVKFFEGADFQSGASLMDGTTSGIFNGAHNVVINAWDTAGNLYQGRVSFVVTGDGFNILCAFPSNPGINFCSPPSNAILSTRLEIGAAFRGQFGAGATAIKLYVDDVEQAKIEGTDRLIGAAGTKTQGNHHIAIVAWDPFGNVYKTSRLIKSTYTYNWSICDPHGSDCLPGFNVRPVPERNAYVGNSFRLQVSIEENPLPITGMKAYIGSSVVAASDGPMLIADLSNVPSGTQKLTLQAWDIDGVLYRVQYNLNVNVPH